MMWKIYICICLLAVLPRSQVEVQGQGTTPKITRPVKFEKESMTQDAIRPGQRLEPPTKKTTFPGGTELPHSYTASGNSTTSSSAWHGSTETPGNLSSGNTPGYGSGPEGANTSANRKGGRYGGGASQNGTGGFPTNGHSGNRAGDNQGISKDEYVAPMAKGEISRWNEGANTSANHKGDIDGGGASQNGTGSSPTNGHSGNLGGDNQGISKAEYAAAMAKWESSFSEWKERMREYKRYLGGECTENREEAGSGRYPDKD